MFINAGARRLLLEGERQRFLGEEWPRIQATIQRLGLTPEDLLDGKTGRASSDAVPPKTGKTNPPEEER